MRRRQVLPLVAIVAGVSFALGLLDQWWEDETFSAGDFAFDVFEWVVLFGAMAAIAWITFEIRELHGGQAVLRQDLDRAVALGEAWRAESSAALDDLSAAILRQFGAWSLTPAEADIAGLMLKGVALRDIAQLRRTSEITIRQQAQSIYRKSGLAGRAELSAYFLESLFEQGATERPRA